MFQARKYHSSNSLQVRDIDELLQKFIPKMKWSSKQKIMDVGCGPGNVTHNYLLPSISSDAELLGIDISEAMIHFANSHYEDVRLNFEIKDITKWEIFEKFKSTFDSVFSFYCIQWIPEQRNAMENIFSILKPGGECLFIFIADSPHYTLYELLGESAKWSPYMKNYRNAISPYRYSADPASEVRNLMQDVGFHITECSLESKSFTFPLTSVFYKWLDGLNPFLKNIPIHLLEEYDQEWKKTLWDENICTLHEETNEVTIVYTSITVFAHKAY